MSLTNMKYPNLELLEYQFKQQLLASDCFTEKVKKIKETNRFFHLDFDVKVFSQIWGSTCTAFDIDNNGNPVMSGDAMTKAYTVVIQETNTSYYGVFVDDKLCYLVNDPPKEFFEDLYNCSMVSKSEAYNRY